MNYLQVPYWDNGASIKMNSLGKTEGSGSNANAQRSVKTAVVTGMRIVLQWSHCITPTTPHFEAQVYSNMQWYYTEPRWSWWRWCQNSDRTQRTAPSILGQPLTHIHCSLSNKRRDRLLFAEDPAMSRINGDACSFAMSSSVVEEVCYLVPNSSNWGGVTKSDYAENGKPLRIAIPSYYSKDRWLTRWKEPPENVLLCIFHSSLLDQIVCSWRFTFYSKVNFIELSSWICKTVPDRF